MAIQLEDTLVVFIDLQDRLVPAMDQKDFLIDRAVRLAKGVKTLDIPFIVTQQYTKGIGETIAPVKEALGNYEAVEKMTFSCCGTEDFVNKVKASKKQTVVIAGTETHVCVQQTVLDLLDLGYTVYLVTDCAGSRSATDKKIGIKRMRDAGAVVTTAEALLFEWIGGAKHPKFKEISNIVK